MTIPITSAAFEGFGPGRLWSLSDMLRVYAKKYLELGGKFLDFEVGLFYEPELEPGESRQFPELTEKQKASLKTFFHWTAEHCRELGLRESAAAFHEAAKELPETEREFRMYRRTFERELERQVWLSISGSRARYYDRKNLLSEDAAKAFPTSYEEIGTAGRCYALELDTASVFHCMRALEPALKVMAADVNVAVGVDAWQNVLNNIASAIDTEAKNLPRGTPKTDRLQFLAQAAMEFSYFKDGWRNHVSHGRGAYGQEDSKKVLEHVRTFVEHLATRLCE